MKKILILTAGFGEGHNAAARGVREGLERAGAGRAEIEVRDLLAETYPIRFQLYGKSYQAIVNHFPHLWRWFYDYLDSKENFHRDLAKYVRLRDRMSELLERFRPDVVMSVFPSYPYLLDQIFGTSKPCKSVVIVTDSITVNKIWYRSNADYFLLPNEESADVLRAGGIASSRLRVLGFPVSPKFADLTNDREPPWAASAPRVLYMVNAGTRRAPPRLVDALLDLKIALTVTVGRNERLSRSIEAVAGERPLDIVGWTNEMPQLLQESHLLIGKAGGASVQETIAARCPMIINHIVGGQEEGNARLIEQTNCGVIARSQDEVISQVRRTFADGAKQWREWAENIARQSRPKASLDIAEFLMSI